MLLAIAILSFAAAAFVVARTVTVPARRRRDVVKRISPYGSSLPALATAPRANPRLLDPVWRAIAPVMLRLMPRTTRESVDRRLIAAGMAPRMSVDRFLGLKGLFAAFGVLLGLVIASVSAVAGVLAAILLGLLGLFGPDMVVNGRTNDRRDRIQAALPDALDLLAVSVEAGLSFEGAVAKLVEYMKGPLIDQFALMLNEIRVGETRVEALKRMQARIEVDEVSTFVGAVVQAEQLGTSMGDILRALAQDARIHRQLTAEEKAMKLPVKMLVPLGAFILPATLIVVLGSALLNIGHLF